MPPKTPSTSRTRKTESEAFSSKHNELSLAQKLSVIKDREEWISLRKLGEKYNVGKSTIQRTLAGKEDLQQATENPANLLTKRTTRMTKNDINSALVEFFRRCRDRNFILSGPVLEVFKLRSTFNNQNIQAAAAQ